jgi:ketosteroid isomerase-like protein
MLFDPDMFLTHYADAYNGRNLEKLREFLALDDPRFAVFEDISEKLFNRESYGAALEGAFDATGEMSFELLRCDRFGDFAIIHAIQKIVDEDEEGEGVFVEARFRTTMWVVFKGGVARVVAANFSRPPVAADAACSQGMCTG